MFYRIEELRNKQVVCVRSGDLLGYVSDIEIDSLTGKIESVVIFGKPRILGLFGKREDVIIPWDEIEVLGSETILVKSDSKYCKSI